MLIVNEELKILMRGAFVLHPVPEVSTRDVELDGEIRF